MIVLDTNVLSTLMRESPEPRVVRWLNLQSRESVCTTAVCLFEIEYGLSSMPQGKRRRALFVAMERLIDQVLERRVLAFDTAAATQAARIAARARAKGRPI